jgi:hypothetical protein
MSLETFLSRSLERRSVRAVTDFTQMFSVGDDPEPESPDEPGRPRWFGPPEDELGAVLPQGLVLGRSDRAVIALSHTVVYSTGVAFDFVAQARGLTRSEANRVFNEQHMVEEGDLADALLRIGFEFADGTRVSNLGGWRAHRTLMSPGAEPKGPLLLPHDGGGGTSSGSEVTMKPGYWLWPLPPSGPLRISCEWPLGEIALTTVEINGAALEAAAEQVTSLWR